MMKTSSFEKIYSETEIPDSGPNKVIIVWDHDKKPYHEGIFKLKQKDKDKIDAHFLSKGITNKGEELLDEIEKFKGVDHPHVRK